VARKPGARLPRDAVARGAVSLSRSTKLIQAFVVGESAGDGAEEHPGLRFPPLRKGLGDGRASSQAGAATRLEVVPRASLDLDRFRRGSYMRRPGARPENRRCSTTDRTLNWYAVAPFADCRAGALGPTREGRPPFEGNASRRRPRGLVVEGRPGPRGVTRPWSPEARVHSSTTIRTASGFARSCSCWLSTARAVRRACALPHIGAAQPGFATTLGLEPGTGRSRRSKASILRQGRRARSAPGATGPWIRRVATRRRGWESSRRQGAIAIAAAAGHRDKAVAVTPRRHSVSRVAPAGRLRSSLRNGRNRLARASADDRDRRPAGVNVISH